MVAGISGVQRRGTCARRSLSVSEDGLLRGVHFRLGVGKGVPAARALILPEAGSRRALHTRDRARASPALRCRCHHPCQGDESFARVGGGPGNRVPGELLARTLLAGGGARGVHEERLHSETLAPASLAQPRLRDVFGLPAGALGEAAASDLARTTPTRG